MKIEDDIVVDTPEGIEHFRVAAIIGALRLEVRTGVKVNYRVSLVKACKFYGFNGRQKKDALEFMENYYLRTYGKEYGKP